MSAPAPTLRRHPRFASGFLAHDRDIVVYLPPGYERLEAPCPVLYLHDGQNLFEPARAHVPGQHWRIGETVDALVSAGAIPPVIVVGIDNTGTSRIHEYTPTKDARLGGGEADAYGRFLIEELKPFVDRTYRTRTDPAGTTLGGSSLGALVTLHVGLTRPGVFGTLVAMSPSVWWDRRAILSTVRRTRPRPPVRIWADIGTAEGRRALDDARMLKAALVGAGWTPGRDLHYAEYEGATHSETAWAERFAAVAKWALLPCLVLLAVLLARPVSAQEAPGPEPAEPPAPTSEEAWRAITFGATLEAYYQYNANRPPDRISQLRAYDTRANTFAIQQATVLAELAPAPEEGRRFGLRLDLMFGQATETVQGSPANEPRPEVYRHIWQAYGSYVFPVGRGLRADVGKFASSLGMETNYAKDDDHFSRSYLFNFLPFYHAGLRTSLPVHDRVTLMYMLTNGIQQTEDFNDFKSHHVAAVVTPARDVSWTLNYFFGREQPDAGEPEGPDGWFRVLDTYVAWTPRPALSFGADVNYVTSEVQSADPSRATSGLGAYARYKPRPEAALALRYEWLDDEGNFAGEEQVLQELTLTGEWRLADGFLARLELRRDWSNIPFFTGPGGDTDLRRQQNTATIGLVWWVGNKKGPW